MASSGNAFLRSVIRSVSACILSLLWIGSAAVFGQNSSEPEKGLKILFLGDQGHHRPADLYRVLGPALRSYGIDLTYSEDVPNSLTARRLAEFDGLLIYANIDQLGADEEKAMLEYVAQGHGIIPLHCASFCFRN